MPAYTNAVPCKHCQKLTVWRARGLCGRCYNYAHIRNRYPPQGHFCKRQGSGIDTYGQELPAEATQAQPGTEAKIVVLRDRCEAGVSLWHPLDFVGEEE